MLAIINNIWETGIVPLQCKHCVIVPILKPHKEATDVSSYRPIALNDCFIKIIEKIIKERMVWFTEKHSLLPSCHSAFRKARSTKDNITQLENDIQKSTGNKEHTLAVFFDMEKAYDRLWKEGLIYKLNKLGFQGNIVKFLWNYLSGRSFQVRANKYLSGIQDIDEGLPQGSSLSPVLFNLMLSDIPMDESVSISIYADDCVIWKSGKNIDFLKRKVQTYVNILNEWFNRWGFTLPKEKSVTLLFSNTNKCVQIDLDEVPLPQKDEHSFLGVLLDRKLTWRPHINMIVTRAKKKINIMKRLVGTKWGSSYKSLLNFYKVVIRPLLDYAAEAYDSAHDHVKNFLLTIQYQALKLCTGALPGTSLESLQVDTGELPLDLRRYMLSKVYKAKIRQNAKHPLQSSLKNCWQFEYEKNKKARKPFGLRVLEDEILYTTESFQSYTPMPPWHLSPPEVSLNLHELVSKSDNIFYQYNTTVEYINTTWKENLHIYTDGSRDPAHGNASACFYVPAMRRPGNVQSSRWSLQADTQRVSQQRYESQDTDNAPYDKDFPHVARQLDKRPNQKRSNSQPRMTRSRSRALPTTSTNRRHHDSSDTDERRFTFVTGDIVDQRSRNTSTRASNAAQPGEPATTVSRPREVAPNRPERSSDTADQTTPPKLTNHQQSKITQFIEKVRLNSDRENNVQPTDRSVSDRCSPDENTSYDSASSQEDESVSAEYSECEEDTVTEHQSDLSAESPDPEKLEKGVALLEEGKQVTALVLLKEGIADITKRKKHIRIADKSEAGWSAVDEYLSDELASDSEDEKRIRQAQARAARKRKASRSTNKGKSAKNVGSSQCPSTSTTSDNFFRGFGSRNRFPLGSGTNPSTSSWRGYASGPRPTDYCFACGKQGHWRRGCPGGRNQGSSFRDGQQS
ncbi:uncharacterized protein LOC121430987 [Lytechinus variegatus]|uniref:uncharacterized protein LOC121430987 n=1 Tax=Lytechinus variegatus TaxID=7654 RepID=UPI001BB12881|nr:uncharacterized protein LOC121430987 [Lytechinus variegatus]